MAPKRKATNTTVAVGIETEKTAVNSHDATEQLIGTKKPNKKAASKNNPKTESEVANDDDVDISPKMAKKRPKRENAKKVVNYVEQSYVDEKIEPVKKKSRGKKASAALVEANENSENDKHVANNSTQADGSIKKRTKKSAVKDDVPAVDKEEEKPVEEKPKKAKSTKSTKKEDNEDFAEVQAPKKKPRSKVEETESTNAQPVPKARKRTTDKPDEVIVDKKRSKKVTKKTIDASPEKKSVKSRKADKKEEKTDFEVKSSPAKKKKVMQSRFDAAKNEETITEDEAKPKQKMNSTTNDDTKNNSDTTKVKESKETSNDDTINTSQNFSSDEEHEPPKDEMVVKKRVKQTAHLTAGGMLRHPRTKYAAVTERNKNEKTTAEDKAKPKQKMNSTTNDDTKINSETTKVKESKETSNVDTITQNLPCGEEHEPPKEEMVVKRHPRTKYAAVTERNKNEKTTAEDKAKPKQKMNSTTTDYSKINFESDKEHTLKICSWNVAGLRALVAKNGFEYFEHEKPDIICLQEIKCLEEEVPSEAKIPGYHMYWCSKPGGRGGVALYSKKMPYNIENDIGDDEMDEEGRIITAEYSKFYLVGVYVPNAGRKLVNLDRRLRWNKMFEEHVNKLKAIKPVAIVGDMNVAHNEIDLANPKTNTKNAGFSAEERNGMSDLLSHGFIDTFRHLYPERKDVYSFWSYMGRARTKNVGWRLDYGIVSDNLAPKVVDNIIRTEVLGSDHCPMLLLLNL